MLTFPASHHHRRCPPPLPARRPPRPPAPPSPWRQRRRSCVRQRGDSSWSKVPTVRERAVLRTWSLPAAPPPSPCWLPRPRPPDKTRPSWPLPRRGNRVGAHLRRSRFGGGGRWAGLVQGVAIALCDVVELRNVGREGGVQHLATFLECAHQLLLRQRPQDRNHPAQNKPHNQPKIARKAQKTSLRRAGRGGCSP